MSQEGPDSDIVLSSRIRLARNIVDFRFPTLFSSEEAMQIVALFERTFAHRSYGGAGRFELYENVGASAPIEKRVLVEKHLISPHLAEDSPFGACLPFGKWKKSAS
ncbi:hypothetical protein [Geobacillus thermoleovorans]|uniref:hypothetical protein n=1 Tax=Geobacillus thermoleovorans TaxID=33941 RepID=UPI000A84D798|nr:hypothetical protein [Geobacillus thermoleovorans]